MQICHAVKTGVVSQDLKYLEVGGLCHSRWLTLGCRILRYYVSKKKPTKNLRTLTEYLIRVYFPCWFRIKHYHRITDGSKSFFPHAQTHFELSKSTGSQCWSKRFAKQCFFAHHENVILAILADDDEFIRTIAVNKIFQRRIQNVQNEESNSAKIRTFILPTLHASATIYFEMASLDPSSFHELPAIRGICQTKLCNNSQCVNLI